MNEKWDSRFIELVRHISFWSKDPSTQCGAVITKRKKIIGTGYNGFPQETDDCSELYKDRERKYKRVIHAEINSLLNAKTDVSGCTIYVYPLPPCSQCAAAIIQAGITRVVSIQPTEEQVLRWKSSFEEAQLMFQEAGVILEYI